MQFKQSFEKIDYLIIGHITQDKVKDGFQIGGTAVYAAKTAQSMGLRVGIYTSWGEESGIDILDGIHVYNPIPNPSTQFENIGTKNGRKQKISKLANDLEYYQIPQNWRETKLVHFAPVAQEFNANSIKYFSNSDVLITPQGWLRDWDIDGNVSIADWPEYKSVIQEASTIVLSEADVNYDDDKIYSLASNTKILIVTKGKNGAILFQEGKEHHIPPIDINEVDATGAGDIFSTSFFIQYQHGMNAIDAANFASGYAGHSVQYSGSESFPTEKQLYQF